MFPLQHLNQKTGSSPSLREFHSGGKRITNRIWISVITQNRPTKGGNWKENQLSQHLKLRTRKNLLFYKKALRKMTNLNQVLKQNHVPSCQLSPRNAVDLPKVPKLKHQQQQPKSKDQKQVLMILEFWRRTPLTVIPTLRLIQRPVPVQKVTDQKILKPFWMLLKLDLKLIQVNT